MGVHTGGQSPTDEAERHVKTVKRSLEEQRASDLSSGLLSLSFLKNVGESS